MNNEEHLLLIAFFKQKTFVRKLITEYPQIARLFSILSDKSLTHLNLFDQSIWYLINIYNFYQVHRINLPNQYQ